MKYLTSIKKYKDYLLVAILIVIIIIGYIWANRVTLKSKEKIKEENDIALVEEEQEVEIKKIMVDIKGMVKNPNVYELDENARVSDLIKKAGGLAKDANTDIINLSKKLKDEEVIIIYSNNEMNSFKEEALSKYSKTAVKITCPDTINDACISKTETKTTNDTKNTEKTDSSNQIKNDDITLDKDDDIDNKININEATKEELMTLSGIGESKAITIITYRSENGNFATIEDIKNVKGIGESVYEKIKDNITT